MTTAPSAERLRHAAGIEAPRVDTTSFRQGWRVTPRLDALRDAGKITPGVWQAAVEYRDAWDRAWASRGGDLGGTRVSGGTDVHARQLGRIAALGAVTAVEQRIGGLATALVVACVVEDLSWPEIGRRCGRHHQTAEAWTIMALRALAWAWATRPGAARGPNPLPRRPARRVDPL